MFISFSATAICDYNYIYSITLLLVNDLIVNKKSNTINISNIGDKISKHV